jgi:hypothetical protein
MMFIPGLFLEVRRYFLSSYILTLYTAWYAPLSLSHTLYTFAYNYQNIAHGKFDRKLCRIFLALIRDGLPIKLRALHICAPQVKPPFDFMLPIIKFLAGKSLRRRMVVHSKCEYIVVMGLVKYGFSLSIIPFEVGGDYHWETCHAEWLADRFLVERRREEALER